MKYHGRCIFPGKAQGTALVTSQAISFYGGVDPETGIVVERGHELEGQCITGKVLVFPTGKGSTVGSYTIYRLKQAGQAPLAVLNASCETITAVGCIIAEIPCIDQLPIEEIPSESSVTIDNEQIIVEPPDTIPTNGGKR
jgi:predicted aconitase with swiveling domain